MPTCRPRRTTPRSRCWQSWRQIVAAVNTAEQYGQVGYYAEAAIPARYALERGALERSRGAPTVRTTTFPFIDAITHFARAVGAARSGNAAAAKSRRAEARRASRDARRATKDEYWAQQVDIQHKAAQRAGSRSPRQRKDEALSRCRRPPAWRTRPTSPPSPRSARSRARAARRDAHRVEAPARKR